MAKYSYEFKLKIVQAYLNGEGGYRFLAEKYGVADFKELLTKLNFWSVLLDLLRN